MEMLWNFVRKKAIILWNVLFVIPSISEGSSWILPLRCAQGQDDSCSQFKNIAITILLSCFFCLTSCGFHLRGQPPLAPSLKCLYIQTKDPYGQLTKYLKQYLKMSGVNVVDNPKETSITLEILNEHQADELQSVSGTQQTRQYNLVLTVTFQIADSSGRTLIQPQTVRETRPLTIQANQTLAGSNEEANLYRQMRQSIIFNIISRLSSHEITQIIEQSSKSHPK